jgi:hypothetical protein
VKYVLIVIALFLLSFSAKGQKSTNSDSLVAYHLKLSGSALKTSGILQISAGLFAGLAYAVPSTNTGFQPGKVLLATGGFCELISLIEYFSAADHLQKAGTFQMRGASVSYRF